MDLATVRRAMLDEFAVRGAASPGWPDPHPDMTMPADDEYSRVTDWSKYRIVGERVESWVQALVSLGLATVIPSDTSTGSRVPTRALWLQPVVAAGVPLHIEFFEIDGIADSSVELRPAVMRESAPPTPIQVRPPVLPHIPHCGCDACDDGSEMLLEEIDDCFERAIGEHRLGTGPSWLV